MDDHKTAALKKNTVTSIFSLFFQSGYSAVLGLIANLVLTIVISPEIYGIYIIVLSIISFLNYFSDIGLAASLVQRESISDEDIKTTFTIQQVLIITIITIGFTLTSYIKTLYELPTEGIYLYWTLLAAFFISSLKTIPSIYLERKIQFQKIVTVQIIENTSFYLAIIIFGSTGFGVTSFIFAILIRAITGLVVMYRLSFWIPKFGIYKKSMRELLSFGIPFQSTSFLALFKDELIILYLGKVLGLEALGYIGWAKKWAEAPIRIIMDNVSRVMFPVLSRIQDDKPKLSSVVEKMLNYQTKLLAPAMVGIAIVMPMLVFILPQYQKWAPALPIFYLFTISAFFATYSTPFINLFNAVGKVKIPFIMMVFWTSANWLLTYLLTKLYGIYGFPVAQVVLAASFGIVLYFAKKIVSIRFLPSILPAIFSAIIMGCIVRLLLLFMNESYLTLITAIAVGGLSYYTIQLLIFKTDLVSEVRKLFQHA